MIPAPETLSTDRSVTEAVRAAANNFLANLRSLRKTQPALAGMLKALPENMEWVFGRDGSLTALKNDGQWWAGCSIPKRAAQFMLKKAELEGTLLCFLYPLHAAQIRVALERARPEQAVLALTPSRTTLLMLLACDDFSAEIEAHRLYFAAGAEWEQELNNLFEDLPGLPTPTQFIRPILVDPSVADEMIAPAQTIFAEHSNRRSERVRGLRLRWKSAGLRRICVVAPSLFRLWDDAGYALATAMKSAVGEIEIHPFNSDDPVTASSAALATAAATCDAIVTPNIGRGDLPDLVPDDMPWATWLTTPRIPPVEKAGPRDSLLIADPQWKTLAIQNGWKSDQIFFAGWPPADTGIANRSSKMPGVFEIPTEPFLAIISDTLVLEAPPHVIEYSSHRLLWDAIERELLANPFALVGSTDEYLTSHMRQAHLGDDGFDRRAFLDGVVLHAWQQGLARLLLHEKVAVKLFGQGWDKLDEFARCACGPVRSREELNRIVISATAIVHTWPMRGAHPMEATGKPVIRPGSRREKWVSDAKLALSRRLQCPKREGDSLCRAIVIRALSQFNSRRIDT